MQLRVTVGLEDVCHGATKRFAINRTVPCGDCSGSGAIEANAARPCSACQGRGVQVRTQRVFGGVQRVQRVCPSCRGEGRSIPPELLCKACGGQGTATQRHVVEVSVPEGVADGHTQVLRGAGDRLPGAEAGDVVLVFAVREHERFLRQGQHLLAPLELSLAEALTGAAVVLEHPAGRTLILRSSPGEVLKPGAWRRVRGEGLPGPGGMGDLFLRVEVRFPERLDEPAARELAQKLAPDDRLDDLWKETAPADAPGDDWWRVLRRFIHRLCGSDGKADEPPSLADAEQPEGMHERVMEPAPELADVGLPSRSARRSRL